MCLNFCVHFFFTLLNNGGSVNASGKKKKKNFFCQFCLAFLVQSEMGPEWSSGALPCLQPCSLKTMHTWRMSGCSLLSSGKTLELWENSLTQALLSYLVELSLLNHIQSTEFTTAGWLIWNRAQLSSMLCFITKYVNTQVIS